MKKVLVVDDELSIRESLRMILKNDYDVVLASSGKEALETVGNNSLSLILLDVMMPGEDGLKVLEQSCLVPGPLGCGRGLYCSSSLGEGGALLGEHVLECRGDRWIGDGVLSKLFDQGGNLRDQFLSLLHHIVVLRNGEGRLELEGEHVDMGIEKFALFLQECLVMHQGAEKDESLRG